MTDARAENVERIRSAKGARAFVLAAPVIWGILCLLPYALLAFLAPSSPSVERAIYWARADAYVTPAEMFALNAALPVFMLGAAIIPWLQPVLLRDKPMPVTNHALRTAFTVLGCLSAVVWLVLLIINDGRWPNLGGFS